MKNIQYSIENIPKSRVAFVGSKDTYTYRALCELREDNKKTLDFLSGTSVVINGRRRLEFALLLSMLDGKVEQILFLPSDIDADLHEKYYKDAHVQYEVYLENNRLKYTIITDIPSNKNTISTISKWIIPTSGTTNIPKLVSHTFESLTRTAKQNIALGEHYKWGLVFDIYRFSGIQVFLQAMLAGSTLIITEPSQSMSQILSLLAEKQCNALSATPSFWRKVLMMKESNDLPLERITLGGEISDKNILQALRQKYPQAKISHIYASTEVGVGFSVTDGKEGFPLSYLEKYNMKIDKDGVLWIVPSKKIQSYMSNEKMYDSEGYINTGDIVKVEKDRVYFLGRESGAINVGGNKVQPEEVEAILLSTNLLSSAYVYAMNNPMMGSLVCADVILKNEDSDKKESKAQILKYCREHLEGFKVPAIIKFVKEINTTQSGKLKR